jgi:chromosome condensin MukBEF MukE localization factor
MMETIKTNEKIFYGKNGKSKSVLLDYKVYSNMLEIIEDSKLIKIIQNREKEPIVSEEEFKKKFDLI